MRQSGGATALKRLFQQVRRVGVKEAAKVFYWKLATGAFKWMIYLQDRWGWYTYADWIRDNEAGSRPPLPEKLDLKFSFLLTLPKEALPSLSNTLEALLAQSYPRWEVLLLHAPQDAGGIDEALAKEYAQDTRIRRLPSQPNDASVVSLGEAAGQAEGSWIGVLGCGDRLSPQALASVVECLQRQPEAEIIYTDEDHLAQDGKTRQSPFFKPDWSPDLMFTVNYLAHALFRRDLFAVAAAGGGGPEEVVYRCAEQAQDIVHIPEMLVHIQDSTADARFGGDQHSVSLAAHAERIGLQDATVETSPAGEVRVTWPCEEKLVSIIIPTRDQVHYLRHCIDSLLSLTSYRQFEIILVENNSREPETLAYYQQLRELSQVRIVEHRQSFNYSAVNNLGARQARGDLLVFLNNDIEVIEPGWLDEMLRWASRPEVGVVGAKLLHPDGTIQHAGIVIGLEGHASHVFAGTKEGHCGPFGSDDWYRNYSAVTGACMAMRREVFESIGGFDEGYHLVFSDVEICQRLIRHGYRVVYTPFARLLHHEGKTRKQYMPAEDLCKGYADLKERVIQGDPYYNPGLSYSIRIPTFKRRDEEAPIDRLQKIVDQAF
jgi:GT2 family glycosyltransferase